MGDLTLHKSKALIPVGGRPIFEYSLSNFVSNNPLELVPVLGYRNEELLEFIESKSKNLKVTPAYNMDFETTNNMYSLYQAKDLLYGEEFILCNGDVIYNKGIVDEIFRYKGKSAVMLDQVNKYKVIDSPKTIVRDNKILDLGRHIELERNFGYAIGLYKFNKELSKALFDQIEKMLAKGLVNAGFHDPLIDLFNLYEVLPASTKGLLWTDIDEPDDIPKAEEIYYKLNTEQGI